MSIISDLATGGLTGLLQGAGTFAKDIRQAITGEMDPEAKMQLMVRAAELEAAALQADVQLAKGQLDVNLAEAQDPSLFKSGWRPAVGWVCVIALIMQFLLWPLVSWITALSMEKPVMLPALESEMLMTLLFSLLGLGGFRAFEKIKGVASK